MTILITGAAGFIGSSAAEHFADLGWRVVGVDNFDPFYAMQIKRANLVNLAAYDRWSFVEADIRTSAFMDVVCRSRPDVVLHLAARPGVANSVSAPGETYDINVLGTINVMEACKKSNVARVVVASSSSVYGVKSCVPFQEESVVSSTVSPYAASKLACESLSYSYHALWGMSVTCLRFFTVYGPRQRPDLAINKFVRAIMAGDEITVFGNGSSGRDYTYITDIIDGIAAAAERTFGWEAINLGNSKPVLLSELIRAIELATGRTAKLRQEPDRAFDMSLTCASIEKAQRVLGFEPQVGIEEGLERYVKWIVSGKGV